MKMQKFGFRIKTRDGMTVDNLTIQGFDAADAERKLRQIYHHCSVTECKALDGLAHGEGTDLESAISLILESKPTDGAKDQGERGSGGKGEKIDGLQFLI